MDNIDRDGKPSDKITEPTISESNTEEIVDKTANKSSEQADEATTSEYISYANVVHNYSDEEPEEVPGSKYISESTHQKDDMEFDLAEGKYSKK